MPHPISGSGRGADSSDTSRKYEAEKKKGIITELSNQEDVLAKMREAERRALEDLESRGISTDIQAVRDRLRRNMGAKEEPVSSEVIRNPRDSETLKVKEVVAETSKKIDEASRNVIRDRPSLKGRITPGAPGE